MSWILQKAGTFMSQTFQQLSFGKKSIAERNRQIMKRQNSFARSFLHSPHSSTYAAKNHLKSEELEWPEMSSIQEPFKKRFKVKVNHIRSRLHSRIKAINWECVFDGHRHRRGIIERNWTFDDVIKSDQLIFSLRFKIVPKLNQRWTLCMHVDILIPLR